MSGVIVPPDCCSTPIPHGLATKISRRPSPSRSAVSSNLLSALLSSHPPNREPLAAIIGDVRVEPETLRRPRPHGLDTGISLLPSPSKNDFVANWFVWSSF